MDKCEILLLLLIIFLAYYTLKPKETFGVFGGTYYYPVKQSFPYSDLYNCYACPKFIPKPYEMNDLTSYDEYVIHNGRYIPARDLYDTYRIHHGSYVPVGCK